MVLLFCMLSFPNAVSRSGSNVSEAGRACIYCDKHREVMKKNDMMEFFRVMAGIKCKPPFYQ